MTIKINLQLEKNDIPRDYRALLLHLIKRAIEQESKEMFTELYSGTAQKPFTFWAKLPGVNFQPQKKVATLSRPEITLLISTDNNKMAFTIYNGFKVVQNSEEIFEIGYGNKVKITEVKNIREQEIVDDEIIINMLSPLVCRKHVMGEKDKYFLPGEEGFEEYFKINNASRINGGLTIEPIKCKKVLVYAYGTVIPSTLGVFKIKGKVSSLKKAYLTGVGTKTSAGFGKFEVIN